MVFLDIIKAFDRVPHRHLLYKLYVQAGITGRAWGWIRAFLSNRRFRIGQGDTFSDWVSAEAGVPQGCVLSPLLFAIFINDLDSDSLSVVLSLFADDAAAWPRVKSGQHFDNQRNLVQAFLDHVDQWSRRWGLDFSFDKSQLLIFATKQLSPPSPSRPLSLGAHPVVIANSYKYLGLTFQRNGRWHQHFDALVAKLRLTANLIARINHRNHPPSPLITISLVKFVLLPQLSYALAFWRPGLTQERVLNSIIAVPLRRALGLHRSASTARTLWECGIPTVRSLKVASVLQSVSRSIRSHRSGNGLPGALVHDLLEAPLRHPGPIYCRPFRSEVQSIQKLFPLALRLPLRAKQVRAVVQSSMAREWQFSSKPPHRVMKPCAEVPRYLSVDPKPTVAVRARLRFSVALTPHRRHIYGLQPSPACWCGELDGDTDHVLLHCPKFAAARQLCSTALQGLYDPQALTRQLLLGQPPVISAHLRGERSFQRLLHDEVLRVTGDFLLSIDRSVHL